MKNTMVLPVSPSGLKRETKERIDTLIALVHEHAYEIGTEEEEEVFCFLEFKNDLEKEINDIVKKVLRNDPYGAHREIIDLLAKAIVKAMHGTKNQWPLDKEGVYGTPYIHFQHTYSTRTL